MKTLYVHIGTPKTGTTSIQIFCKKNRKVLEKKGFCFPNMPYRYQGKRKERNGAFLTAAIKGEDGKPLLEEERARFSEGLNKIQELFQQFDNVILSDEGIWLRLKGRRKTLWKELKAAAERDGYGIKIIAYLRRQDDFTVSAWNQKIKVIVPEVDATQTWDDFSHKADCDGRYVNLDYYKTLKDAADVLGKEHIIVRRYDRSHLKDGLAQADFLDALGLELTDEYKMDRVILNEKLSLNGCEIKRVLNGIEEISPKESRFFEKPLQDIAEESNREYPSVLWSASDAKAFVARREEDNAKLAEEFIQDGEPLFHERYRDGEVWRRDNPHMSNDIIRFAAMSDIALLREIQKLKQQNQRMQKEIEGLHQFRSKAHHPFKTAFSVLARKLGVEKDG